MKKRNERVRCTEVDGALFGIEYKRKREKKKEDPPARSPALFDSMTWHEILNTTSQSLLPPVLDLIELLCFRTANNATKTMCHHFLFVSCFWPESQKDTTRLPALIRALIQSIHEVDELHLTHEEHSYRFLVDLGFDIFGEWKEGFVHILEAIIAWSANRIRPFSSYSRCSLSHLSPWIWFRTPSRAKDRKECVPGEDSMHSRTVANTYMFTFLSTDLPFIVHVALVPDEHSLHFRWCVLESALWDSDRLKGNTTRSPHLFDIANPVFDVIEALFTGYIVDKHDALQWWISRREGRVLSRDSNHGPAIVSSGDRLETFLKIEMARIELSRERVDSYLTSCIPRVTKRKMEIVQLKATYQICNLIFRPSRSMVLILKSMPRRRSEGSTHRSAARLPIVDRWYWMPNHRNVEGHMSSTRIDLNEPDTNTISAVYLSNATIACKEWEKKSRFSQSRTIRHTN